MSTHISPVAVIRRVALLLILVGPDIDVENWPKDVIAGRDPQLERAVQEAMRMLKEKPVTRSATEPSPPTLGKRPVSN